MRPRHTLAVATDDDVTRQALESGRDAWWRYADEILGHVRMPYNALQTEDLNDLDASVGVLLLATPSAVGRREADAAEAWVRAGGSLVLTGEPGLLARLAGVRTAERHDHGSVGFCRHAAWTKPPAALHAVGGVGLDAVDDEVEVLALWDGPERRAAVTARSVGGGVVITLGVDVWQSVVRIQQGYAVTGDGVPAADGTAPLDDGVLKAEDGLALDLESDRRMPTDDPAPRDFHHKFPPSAAVPIFDRPQADQWRSVLLQVLWWAAERANVVLPWLYYWPAGVPAVAHMSHDADRNDPDDARVALDTFADADVTVTWCQLYPGGYGPEIYREIGSAGHENALHYNAMGDADLAVWSRSALRAQHAWACAVTGEEQLITNKNHYTRWEGWSEFYAWCEDVGIQIDQSRGPSKLGTVGFPFGTAHVSFPLGDVSAGNKLLNVLALPLHTQDLGVATHVAAREVILDAVLEQHGVAHFLFHGANLRAIPGTRRECVELARAVRARGMLWWTSARINSWERARRGVHLKLREVEHGWRIDISSAHALRGAAVLVPVPRADAAVNGLTLSGPASSSRVSRHGRDFLELSGDIPAGHSVWYVRTGSRRPAGEGSRSEVLALDGGVPVRTASLPHVSDSLGRTLGHEEAQAAYDVVLSGRLNATVGEQTTALEEEFAARYSVRHAIAASSGTAALHLAVAAVNPEPGDEIITTGLSDIGSVLPILAQNAVPVFADVDPRTGNLDVAAVRRLITDRTRAILAVHLFGIPAPVTELRELADEHNLLLIEDCAQAYLTRTAPHGRLAGTVGHLGCFSLQQSKHVTAGDGGLVITSDDALARRSRLFGDKAWPRADDRRTHLFLGLNYRMTELQAAVARVQFGRLDSVVERRVEAAATVQSAVEELSGLSTAPHEGTTYWQFPVYLDVAAAGADAVRYAEALRAEGIPASRGYLERPLYLTPLFTGPHTYGDSGFPLRGRPVDRAQVLAPGLCPHTEALVARRLLVIPWNERYTDGDVTDIATALRKVYRAYARS
ncbi:DegT/DnrJ/EryC1/StrS family aminotransferase [Saccharopolyspora sp. NPDC002376]